MKNLKKVLSAALALGLIASVSSLPQASAETNNTSGVVTVTDSAVTKNIAWSDYTANGYALTYGEQTATIPNFYNDTDKKIAVAQNGVPQQDIAAAKTNYAKDGTIGNFAEAYPLIVGSDESALEYIGNNTTNHTNADIYSADSAKEYLSIGGRSYGNKYKVGTTSSGGNWSSNGNSPIVAMDSYSNNGTEYNPVYMSGSVSALNNIVKGSLEASAKRTDSTIDNKPVIFYATHTSGSYAGGNLSKNILGFQLYVEKSETGTPVLKIASVRNGGNHAGDVKTMGTPYDVSDGEKYLYTVHTTNNNSMDNKTPDTRTVTVDVTSKYTPVVSYSGNLSKDEVLEQFNTENSILKVDNFVDYSIYYKQESYTANKISYFLTYSPYAELTVKFKTSEDKVAMLTYTVSLDKAMGLTSNIYNGNISSDKTHLVLKPFLGLSAFATCGGNPQFVGSVRSVLFSDVTVGYEPIGDCVNGGATLAANAESADKQNIKYSFSIADKGKDTFYQYGVKSLYRDFNQNMFELGESAAASAATPITEKREIIGYGAALVKGNTATPEKIKRYVQQYGTKSVFGYALSGQENIVKNLFKNGVNTIESLDKLGSEFSITITSSATDKYIGTMTNMLPFIAYKVTDKDSNESYELSWAGNNSHFEKNGERSDEIIEAGMARKSVFGLMKSIINNNENYQTDEQLTALINKANAGGSTSYTLEQLKGYLSSDTTEAQTAMRNIFFYGVQQ